MLRSSLIGLGGYQRARISRFQMRHASQSAAQSRGSMRSSARNAMRALRIAVAASMALIVAILGGVALTEMWVRAHTLYPTPQNESAFLKTYSPQPMVDRFKCLACYSDSSGGMSTASGKHFVQRSTNYDATIGIRSGQ